jgi:hypothetical protein
MQPARGLSAQAGAEPKSEEPSKDIRDIPGEKRGRWALWRLASSRCVPARRFRKRMGKIPHWLSRGRGVLDELIPLRFKCISQLRAFGRDHLEKESSINIKGKGHLNQKLRIDFKKIACKTYQL